MRALLLGRPMLCTHGAVVFLYFRSRGFLCVAVPVNRCCAVGRVCGVLLPLPARAVCSGHVTVVDNASAVVVADISAHARALSLRSGSSCAMYE